MSPLVEPLAGSLVVAPGGPLVGRISVPGDKSISHRVLMLAALADGASTVRGLSDGGDVACTRRIIEALGADVVDAGDGAISISGGRLEAVDHPLDVGNSGTGIRLLAGLLAGLPFRSVLDGDASIRRRPMDRVLDPLRLMGASLRGRDGQPLAPLEIRGGGLRGIEYRLPVASAQVKGCVLFAGLSAEGPTTVLEDRPSRAHTEELMMAFGITLDAGSDGDLRSVTVQPGRPTAFDHDVAGDPSQAAFWAVAASILPGSEVVVANVYAGPARSGFVDVLSRMGADITHDPTTGDLTVRHSGLTGTVVTADEVPGLVDEVPILAVAAACADGETTFEGVGELRVKESDRLATVESELGRMGADVRVDGDTLVVRGSALTGAEVDSHHDHRIAMACAVAALVADGPTTIHGWDAVATSYPGFVADLDLLRGGT
ncbi:MAG: 3-phosphoshikimate 1-carboxyvinyltransferase [Acidimicrobiales bacterium]|nr:3-phosphoshikimate 1-carboxyvinyltransferase [Acidimicrobiales bacterium]